MRGSLSLPSYPLFEGTYIYVNVFVLVSVILTRNELLSADIG